MRKLANFVIRYRIFIILLTIILTIFFGYQIKNLTINSDILSYLPQDDPLVIIFNEVGEKFGGNSLAIVALESDDAFSHENLTQVNEITKQFQEINEVSNVMSLTNILDIKKTEWGLEIGKLVDKYNIPEDIEELKNLRDYTLGKDMYKGSLVSSDGEITVIISRLKDDADKITTGRFMRKIVEETKSSQKIYYGGIPFQMIFLVDIIKSDIVKLVPIVVVLVMSVLFLSFRSRRGVFLPLSCVLISTVWVMGIMSLLKISITILSNAMPVILIAVGTAYSIHMLSKYNEDVRHGDNTLQGIRDALSEVGIPIILTGVTTLIGFMSFLTSTLNPIREFGVFSALGVAIAMIISITFLPAVLSFLKVKDIKNDSRETADDWSAQVMGKFANLVIEHTKTIIIGISVIVLAFIFVFPSLSREVNMIDYFKKTSEIRQAEEMMESRLGGSIPIQIMVDGDLKNPFVLKEILRFEKYLETLPDIHDPQSIADLICEMNWVMNGHYTIPDSREGVTNLWFFLDGNEIMDQLVTSGDTEGLIQAKIGTVNTKQINTLVKAVDKYIYNDLRTDLVSVKLSTAAPELAAKLIEERTNRIISGIDWDIKKYGSTWDADNSELKKIITAAVMLDSNQFDNTLKNAIAERIIDYFGSEEADIPIESELLITGIIDKIENLLQFEETSLNKIYTVLQDVIPGSLYADNPEILDYTAEAIEVIINDETTKARVNNLITEIKPYLSGTIADDNDFLKDLRDNVWEINEDETSIEYSVYTNLVNEKTNAEDRITLSVKQTGMPIIYMDLDRQIVKSQALSLFFSILLVFLLLSYRFKSIVGGLISIAPIVITILLNFTIMAIFRIPLDIVTALIGSVAVGIGIDYTIHFTNRYTVEYAQSMSKREAVKRTFKTTGKAIFINAFSVMMGFLVLILGNIVPMQRFGYLLALTMAISALASVTILPSLFLISRAQFISKLNSLKIILNKSNTK